MLRPTAEKVDELRGLPDKQLLDDWFTEFTRLRALQHRAADKEPDDRIIAITDERIRQIPSAEARLSLGRTYVAVRVVTW